MKTYAGSIYWLLASSIIFTLTSGTQLAINMYYDRIVFILFFAIFTLGFLFFTIMLTLDLMTKNTKSMSVTIIETDHELIRVLKPNGKIRKIRIPSNDIHNYQSNQKVVLTLTKRTGQLKAITPSGVSFLKQ